MDDLAFNLPLLLKGGSMLLLFLVLMLVARYLHRFLTPYDVDQQITGEDNVAQATSLAGYYVGVTILFCGAYLGPTYGFWQDLLQVGGYTLLGLGLLNLSRYLNDHFILPDFSVATAIREQRNPAAGVILCANYIASALIVAGAIHGEGGGVVSALVFYALGQLALVLFGWLYEKLTPYAIQTEIEKGNLAAGFGFGGSLIALGVVIMGSVNGDFVSWAYNLSIFVIHLLIVFVYLILARLFFDKLLLAGADLNKEIAQDRNIGAGLLESALAVSFASVLFFMVG